MKRNILIYTVIIFTLILTGCEYDNFDEPTSVLSGRVVYDGNAIGVRQNGPQLELWQDGYALKKNIPIYIAQDGTYSVVLFDGQYKMVRKAGAPWEPQLKDTILINVKNNTSFDVSVTPYFIINKETFQRSENSVTAKFTINKVVESANLSSVRLYLGSHVLLDQNKKEYEKSVEISNITIGEEATVTATIPSSLAGLEYIFARIGVCANVSSEYCYTPVQKIMLK